MRLHASSIRVTRSGEPCGLAVVVLVVSGFTAIEKDCACRRARQIAQTALTVFFALLLAAARLTGSETGGKVMCSANAEGESHSRNPPTNAFAVLPARHLGGRAFN